jgi:diguanylate cyclase (GGDEF)-like protein
VAHHEALHGSGDELVGATPAHNSGRLTRSTGLAPQSASDSDVAELQQEIIRLRRDLRMLRMANMELERVAIMDTLTPLYNRRHFISALNEHIVRRKRYGTRCAVLFVDVNKLKYINDVFGHGAGDFALVHAAQILSSNIRETDLAARIGGDEFAILLEEVDGEAARLKATQLEEALRASVCAYGEDILPMSASIGLTHIEPNDRDEAIIERADSDMYARKRAWHEAQKG